VGRALATPRQTGGPTSLILVWLQGGPSQLDTFDPKPGTLNGGPTQAIDTAVRGLQFAEHFPGLAERARKLAVVRSLTSREGDHERATYLLHTGYTPAGTVRHPTLGSVLSAEAGGADLEVPAFVSLGQARAGGPGFLGAAHAPYQVGGGGGGELTPTRGLDRARLDRRRALQAELEQTFAREAGLPGDSRAEAYAQADRYMHGPLREALTVSGEAAGVRRAYGEGGVGDRLLAARRLVEVGARAVEVVVDGWDEHQQIFSSLPGRARQLDRGLAALLDDLEQRELLERTLVVCMGEFGRTPTINERQGRDHYPQVFSSLLFGAGIPGGTVVGSSTPDGSAVATDPVRVPDLFATVAARLGLDPAGVRYAGDRPITLTDAGQPIPALSPG
jgi:uncharacterized protein (DUF1501 family)